MQRILFFLFLSISVQAQILEERLVKARSGDYIVLEANKMVTLLAVRGASPSSLILEEITAPLSSRPASWSEWVEQKAPGHTSWSMVEIDPKQHLILECYSFSRGSWIEVTSQESLLATLLSLPLQSVPREQLRKIGPPPQLGEADHRKIWSPPFAFEGHPEKLSEFEVFEGSWPDDNSDLSGEKVVLYFETSRKFPFPAWIEVVTTHATAPIRALDAGHHLPSPYRTIPRRVPEFIGPPTRDPEGLRLSIRAPRYFRSFELFAIDVTAEKGKTIVPLSHSLSKRLGESVTLEIPSDELNATLEKGHRYSWLAIPTGYSEFYAQSTQIFVWE